MVAFRRWSRAAILVTLVLIARPSAAEEEDPQPSGPVSMTEGGAFFDQVDPRTGAMTYTYRFELPRARGISGPALSLRYNSSTRDREAGYGWGLDLPSIELRPLSGLARFDAGGAPLPLGRERYVFAGQSLVRICVVGAGCATEPSTQGHPSWASGWTYYRTHVEGLFARFYRSADRATWRVQFKGGEVLDFGTPVGESYGMPSAVESKGAGIVRWRPVVRRDLQHPTNVVVYRWQPYGSRGLLYLTDIYDTPSLSAPTDIASFAHHTQLNWDGLEFPAGNRQSPERAMPDFRLRRVAVASMPWSGVAPREVYRVYTLDYYAPRGAGVYDATTQGPLWHHSFLKQINVEGHCPAQTENGDGTIGPNLQCRALPPVRFEYEPGASIGEVAPTSQIDSGPPGAVDNNQVLPFPASTAIVDFDRDGLPDVIQSWESPCGPIGGPRRTAVRNPNAVDQPELWCLQPLNDDGDPIGSVYDYKIRSARPILGYLNRGGSNFRYQCMDAGDRFNPNTIAALNAGPWTDQQNYITEFFDPPSSRTPHGDLQASNTVLGSFGNALGVWGRHQYLPFFARSVAVPQFEPGQEPPTLALGGCSLDESFDNAAFYPRWQWESQKAAIWTYGAPTRPDVNDGLEYFVDVDGDGYADVLRPLSGLPAPPQFRVGTVAFTTRYGTGDSTPGVEGGQPIVGPALLPFVEDPDAPQNTLVPVERPWDPAVNGRKTQVFYADVNGDGLPDLVTSNFAESGGTLRIRPGDGTGTFSCAAGDPGACIDDPDDPSSSFYEATVTSANKPWWAVRNGFNVLSFFMLHDVTGDGLADIVRYNAREDGTAPAGVEVWVNLDGQTFSCMGPGGSCSVGNVVDTTPAHPGYVSSDYRVAFADMNADGVDDVVILAKQGVFRASFFANTPAAEPARGTHPGQLIRVRSAFGATTRIQYQSIQDLDVMASASGTPWAHHSPIVESVVTNVLTEDAATAAGGSLNRPYHVDRRAKYLYRDPAYDGWQRKLVGFRKFSVQAGAEPAITETTSWFGPCENAAPPSRDVSGQESVNFCPKGSDDEFADAATFRSWVGRTVRVDRYVPAEPGQGIPQQMLWSRYYELAQPYALLSPDNDRHVTYAYAQRIETHLYRPEQVATAGSSFVPLAGGDSIELPPVQAGSKIIEQTMVVDTNGTTLEHRELGDVAENDHARVDQRSDNDFGGALAVTCDENWRCRPTYEITAEDEAGTLTPVRRTRLTYAAGTSDLTMIEGYLDTEQFLYRSHEAAADFSAGPPGQSSVGWKVLAEFEHTPEGFVTLAKGPGTSATPTRACTRFFADTTYGQFPETIRQYTGVCDVAPSLDTNLAFDRAFGVEVSSTAPDLGVSIVSLDEFGRAKETFAPSPDDPLPGSTTITSRLKYGDGDPVNYVDVVRYTLPAEGGPIRSVQLLNGLLEPVLRFDQGDGGNFTASGWAERDPAGHVFQSYRPFNAGNTDPVTIAQSASLTSPPATGAIVRSADDFGRNKAVSEDGLPVLERAYEPLAVVLKDAEQVSGAGHAGAWTRIELTTRGPVRRSTWHTITEGDITTETAFDVVGNPRTVYRVGPGGIYSRYLLWDSLGRLVENHEPNTVNRDTDRGWRYSYDDTNRLVGTSDGRGCGKDIYYDSLGRVTGEDYSPCRALHAPYTPANPLDPSSYEVVNTYDAYEAGQVEPDGTFADDYPLAAGRLVSVRDRGAHTRYNYDARGRVRRIGRQVARPVSQQAVGADLYAPHLYKTRSDYDNADRLVFRTSGADDGPFVDNPLALSAETYLYSARGQLDAIDTSYGSIVQHMGYEPDGLVSSITYGDLALTEATFHYGARRRMDQYHVSRAAPALWATPSANYSIPNATDTAQTTLADFAYQYDGVGNPTIIEDFAPAADWRVYASPQRSRTMTYDDLYRVKSVAYGYGSVGGVGTFRSPFKAESNAGDTRPVPLQVQLETRVQNEAFTYDYLGNVTSSTDDQTATYDRSLGAITNGDGTGWGPNQLTSASGVQAVYDGAGNLSELKVTRTGLCTSGANGSKCAQWFAYEWDEVGQLARARRWDYEASVPDLGAGVLPAEDAAWDLHYAYSGGARVVKSAKDSLGTERHTLEVFDTLRFERDEYVTESGDYERHRGTTHVYFGGGIAHAFYDGGTLPAPPGAPEVRMSLNIGDHLGSATVAIDHATSEVVERASYMSHGAIESDYRPDRWNHAREPYKFTGKEEDIEVGATYFGARYYQPHLGRFMSADPLAIHSLGGDLNPYAYVRGALMSSVDPDGLDSPPPGAADVQWHPDTGQWTAYVNGQLEIGTNDVAATGSGGAQIQDIAARSADQLARIEATTIGFAGGPYITPGDVHKEVGNAVVTLPVNALVGALDPTGAIRLAAGWSGHPIAPRVIPASTDPKNVSGVVAGIGLFVASVAIGAKGGAPEAAEAGGGGGGGASVVRPLTAADLGLADNAVVEGTFALRGGKATAVIKYLGAPPEGLGLGLARARGALADVAAGEGATSLRIETSRIIEPSGRLGPLLERFGFQQRPNGTMWWETGL